MKQIERIEIDLAVGVSSRLLVEGYSYASFQAVAIGAEPASAVVTIRRSLTGEEADAQAFGSPVTIDASSRAIVGPIDVRDTLWLHLVTTTNEAARRIAVSVLLTDRS